MPRRALVTSTCGCRTPCAGCPAGWPTPGRSTRAAHLRSGQRTPSLKAAKGSQPADFKARAQQEVAKQRDCGCRAAPVIATGGGGKLVVDFSRGSGGQAVGTYGLLPLVERSETSRRDLQPEHQRAVGFKGNAGVHNREPQGSDQPIPHLWLPSTLRSWLLRPNAAASVPAVRPPSIELPLRAPRGRRHAAGAPSAACREAAGPAFCIRRSEGWRRASTVRVKLQGRLGWRSPSESARPQQLRALRPY